MTIPVRILNASPGTEGAVLDALAAALDGSGPPVAPVRPGTDAGRLGAGVPEGTVLAVTTSGSTGEPRTVLLERPALVASASATEARLGGAGQWLLALPLHHVAGLQVLVRSVLAGTRPVLLDQSARFTPQAFAAAVERLDGPRRYASLVPTQLHRLLGSPEGSAALAGLDAVLVGGAATEPQLYERALAAGARVVRTYGMTETAGGCVYDGVPLEGVRVRLDEDGRIHLSGPVLARGYLGEADLTAATFREEAGERWLRTTDLGVHDDDGALRVLGRVDDVITTGGVKVAPAAVEARLVELAGVGRACVVGVPDAEWGAVVVALLTLEPGAARPALGTVREHVARSLGAAAAPRHLVVVEQIPERGPGKPDRRAAARIAARAVDENPGR